ncbi:hypothetical protein Clacol_003541 [Clathrus columnatus]|uniref:Uncharacterized protein n=1 Tax=Clathrus columnatus TaxID=1419009 RepID=A0AAV5A7T9_9AGAM|nr:hypothetical protein Clacol_003541 [Clathrus columnatus]
MGDLTSFPDSDTDIIDMLKFEEFENLFALAETNNRIFPPVADVFDVEHKTPQQDGRKRGGKRARSLLEEVEWERPAVKKIKLEDQNGDNFSAKKKINELNQAKFLVHYRNQFSALLPRNSKLLDKLAVDHSSGQRITPRRELEDQPSLLKTGLMKDYQLQGLSFLVWMYKNGVSGILGDEMGLGKTLQTLALFGYLKETENFSFPHLVICPLSVLSSWINECHKWFPSLRIDKVHGPAAERGYQKEELRNKTVDIVVTTYEAYSIEDSWYSTTILANKVQGLGCLHRLKNVKKVLQLIMLRRTKQTVELSVPPLDETIVFLPLAEAQRFWYLRLLRRLDTLTLDDIFKSKIEGADEGRQEAAALVHKALLDARQGKQTYKKLMNLLMTLTSVQQQLRRICDHPYIIKGKAIFIAHSHFQLTLSLGAFPEPYEIGEHIVASSSKLQFIDKLFKDLIPKKERILCFSQWTGMLDMLEDYMALREIKYARLDGSVSRPRRTLDIRLFQQEDSPYQVFLLSTGAGSLDSDTDIGINLTKATHVIMCDSMWNPQIDRQAIARCHRIGQTKEVKVRITLGDLEKLLTMFLQSVEDQMLDRLRKKLFLSCKVMTEVSKSQESKNKNDGMSTHELLSILRRGTSAVARWGSDSSDRGLSAFLSSSLEEILARSKRTGDLRNYKIKQEVGEACDGEDLSAELEREEKKLLSNVSVVRTRYFEGQWHERDERALSVEWTEIQKRIRTERLILFNGIESLPDELPYAASKVKIQPRMKTKKSDWEHENTCLDCWDGGDLICCDRCPRVYHEDCRGITQGKLSTICSQHVCADCGRNTNAAGGMLFRCRTCPSALCEDCLPNGDLTAIGSSLPELEALGFGEIPQAYWIYCEDCCTHRDEKQWQDDWEERLTMNFPSEEV